MFYDRVALRKSPLVSGKEKRARARAKPQGGEPMSRQVNRFDRLEQDTHQIKLNLAILTERAETFVTKNDFNALASRADTFATKSDLQVLTERADTFATKSDLQMLAERADTFATKSALQVMAERMETFTTKSDILGLATREELAEVRNDLNLLRVEMYKALTGQTKWLTACMFMVAILSLTAAKLIFV